MRLQFNVHKLGFAFSRICDLVSNSGSYYDLLKSPAIIISALTIALAIIVVAIKTDDWFALLPLAKETNPVKHNLPSQDTPSNKGVLNARLSVEPEVNRMRHRLGKRFLSEGNMTTELIGSLTIGTQQQPILMIRGFNENGETVEIAQSGRTPNLTWSDNKGAVANGVQATGETRDLIERLVLDTPDQFVLAKLRGTAYQIIARNVRPAEVGSDSNYNGPLWNLVEVDERQRSPDKMPISSWRQYYVNVSTGLIDRILSQENGQIITAEVTGWTQQGSEIFPAKIIWSQKKQILMELSVNAIIFKSK